MTEGQKGEHFFFENDIKGPSLKTDQGTILGCIKVPLERSMVAYIFCVARVAVSVVCCIFLEFLLLYIDLYSFTSL